MMAVKNQVMQANNGFQNPFYTARSFSQKQDFTAYKKKQQRVPTGKMSSIQKVHINSKLGDDQLDLEVAKRPEMIEPK